MSLEDRFNPNDGSFIDFVDNAMVGLHKKIGDFWQNKTHKSADKLKGNLYGFSGAALSVYGVMSPSYFVLLCALSSTLYAFNGNGMFSKTPLESELKMESVNLPKKTIKYANALTYFAGLSVILAKSTLIIGEAISGNQDLIKESLLDVNFGLGALSVAAANYIHQTNFDPPPKKSKKKPVLERIRDKLEEFMPQPIPEPVPVKTYSALNRMQS